jgi:trk system potassium uptake protein TrkH
MKAQKKTINPYFLVILSFIVIILVGAVLLMMPFSRTANNFGSFIDCLFLATSATCVTGLNSFAQGIGDELTFWGQLIVMIMIQVGGLGFITLLTFFITLFSRKLQFKNRVLLSAMVNSEDAAEVVLFVRKIILISASFETLGFLLGLPVFLTNCDSVLEGLWYSLFHSISAYNNAGFDLFGSTSLIRGIGNAFIDGLPTWAYYYLCSYIMFLIVAGGISFVVVMDIFARHKFRQLRVFTKISLMMTGILLSVGFIVFFASEGFKSPFDALFQSVTCRTAGFATVDQDSLSVLGKAFSCFLMFFGGNPLGTAGGVKTTTLYIIILAMVCYLAGRKVTSFHRRYSNGVIVKAMSLVLLAVATIFISFTLIYIFESDLDMNTTLLSSTKSASLIYEVFSAFGTVGVTVGITPYLSIGSKIVISILMFIGRLGPITFFQLLGSKMSIDDQSKYHYVEEDFLIG